MLRARRIGVNIVGEVPGHLLAARVNNGIRRAAFERRTRGTGKKKQGKKLDPNDPAIPAEPDKPTALPDEDLDKVAGGSTPRSRPYIFPDVDDKTKKKTRTHNKPPPGGAAAVASGTAVDKSRRAPRAWARRRGRAELYPFS